MPESRITFTDHSRRARHAGESAYYVLDLELLDVLTRDRDGMLFSLTERSDHGPAKSPRHLLELIRSWKDEVLGEKIAERMIEALKDAREVRLEKRAEKIRVERSISAAKQSGAA